MGKQRAIPLKTLRLLAERPAADRFGVIPSFYIQQLVLHLEAQAKRAREFEGKLLPADLSADERHKEQSIRRVRTATLEDAAKQARRAYEAGLEYWVEDE